MDGFSYHNIFEMKGAEYLIIIGFLLMLIPFAYFLDRKSGIGKKLLRMTGLLTPGSLSVPQGIFHSPGHTWAWLKKTGVAEVGADDLLARVTGQVELQNLRREGEKLRRGDVMTEVNHQGKILHLRSPVSGEILEVNPALGETPGLMNSDPYGKGWIYRIKPDNWTGETKSYYLAGAATEWSKNELTRVRDFLSTELPKYSAGEVPVALQEGGELREHLLAELPGELWKEFDSAFLETS